MFLVWMDASVYKDIKGNYISYHNKANSAIAVHLQGLKPQTLMK